MRYGHPREGFLRSHIACVTIRAMGLVECADADRWSSEAFETDPGVTAVLGEPWPLEAIAGIHQADRSS